MDSMDRDDLLPATKADLRAVKGDVSDLKADVSAMKLDFTAMRTDIGSAFGRLDAKIDASTRRLSMEIVSIQADIRDMKDRFVTRDEFKYLVGLVEGIAGQFKGVRDDNLIHGQVLTEVQVELKCHEKRIKTLEDRPQ